MKKEFKNKLFFYVWIVVFLIIFLFISKLKYFHKQLRKMKESNFFVVDDEGRNQGKIFDAVYSLAVSSHETRILLIRLISRSFAPVPFFPRPGRLWLG